MNKDAKIGITATVFIGLVSLLVWKNRVDVARYHGEISRVKYYIATVPHGTSTMSVQNWLRKEGFVPGISPDYIHGEKSYAVIKDVNLLPNNVRTYIGVRIKNPVMLDDRRYKIGFYFNRKGYLTQAIAEEYSYRNMD